MTDKTKNTAERLNTMVLNTDLYNKIIKDRLDFGFDSIYFRYSEAIEELGYYKEQEARRNGEHFDKKAFCNGRKRHFYECLEQLLQAHQEDTE